MTTRGSYVQAIRDIMEQSNIVAAPTQPQYEVGTDDSFASVVQYTDWYLTTHGNEVEHYRFDRYYDAIETSLVHHDSGIWAHIDIGCGAGPFSWAFVDWAIQHGIALADLRLYRFDPSAQMIRLAWMIRHRLRGAVQGYPNLHYESKYDSFVRKLANIRGQENCLITLGHVLAGNHGSEDVRTFARIIERVATLSGYSSKVWLLASDATSGRHRTSFMDGWRALLSALGEGGVLHSDVPIPTGRTSDRCVILSRKEE